MKGSEWSSRPEIDVTPCFNLASHPCPDQQVKCHACVGGTSVREDARILQAGVHVVVGTPGRVYDMLRRRCLRADNIKMFTLDEADEMLSRGFKDQIYDIFQLLPPKLQVRGGDLKRWGRGKMGEGWLMHETCGGGGMLQQLQEQQQGGISRKITWAAEVAWN